MLKKVKQKTAAIKQDLHDQFAAFKSEVRAKFAKKFPKPLMELETSFGESHGKSGDQTMSVSGKIWLFWLSGLAIVVIGFLLHMTLVYIYMLIGAFIISLAMEGVVTFRQRLTRSRGL